MRCFYNTGDKCLDYFGEFLNGNVWVHNNKDGNDWGRRVFVRRISLDRESEGITISVQEVSKRAMVVSVTMDWKSHEKLRPKEIYDVGKVIVWGTLVDMFSNQVSVVIDGFKKKVSINGIWRSPRYDLVYVEDDAIHIVPKGNDCYDVFVEEWMRDVLVEDGILDFTW